MYFLTELDFLRLFRKGEIFLIDEIGLVSTIAMVLSFYAISRIGLVGEFVFISVVIVFSIALIILCCFFFSTVEIGACFIVLLNLSIASRILRFSIVSEYKASLVEV